MRPSTSSRTVSARFGTFGRAPRHARELRRRAGGADATAARPAPGAEIDHVVGGGAQIEVVLGSPRPTRPWHKIRKTPRRTLSRGW